MDSHTANEGVALAHELVASMKIIGFQTKLICPIEIEGEKWQLLSLEFHFGHSWLYRRSYLQKGSSDWRELFQAAVTRAIHSRAYPNATRFCFILIWLKVAMVPMSY